MPKIIFDIGDRVERLTIIEELPMVRASRRYRVRCDCGFERAVHGSHLRPGYMVRCRCGTHGDSRRGKPTPEWHCWTSMKQRCLNPNTGKFKDYGGRGISVCSRWLNSYEDFLADMGRKPTAQHSIDRIDNDGNYEPGNCRWATPSQQMSNQRRSLAYRE